MTARLEQHSHAVHEYNSVVITLHLEGCSRSVQVLVTVHNCKHVCQGPNSPGGSTTHLDVSRVTWWRRFCTDAIERTWAGRLRDELQDAGQRAGVPLYAGDAVDAEAHCDAPEAGQIQRRAGQRLAQQRPRPRIPRGFCACS